MASPVDGGGETKLYFKSSDGVMFELDKGVAMMAAPQSFVLDSVIEDNSTGCIPVLDFKCDVLDKVIEYCYKEARCAPKPSFDREEIKIWDSSFFKVGSDMHYNLIMASRYLDIQGLEFITCKALDDFLSDKDPDEVRKILNNLSPEE